MLCIALHRSSPIALSLSFLTLHAAGEAPPVGEDDERQLLPVEQLDALSRLVGGVREPHLARLGDFLRTQTGGRGVSCRVSVH